MSEPTTDPVTPEPAPAAAPQGKQSLDDLLGGLDEDARKAVLGEVTKARNEAKNLRDRVKSAEPQLAELAALKAVSQTDAERLAAAQNRAEKAERDALRASIALRKGLSPSLASRLQGDDEASLEADADELLALVPQSTGPRSPRPDFSQGSSSKGSTSTDPAEQFAAFLKQQMGRT